MVDPPGRLNETRSLPSPFLIEKKGGIEVVNDSHDFRVIHGNSILSNRTIFNEIYRALIK